MHVKLNTLGMDLILSLICRKTVGSHCRSSRSLYLHVWFLRFEKNLQDNPVYVPIFLCKFHLLKIRIFNIVEIVCYSSKRIFLDNLCDSFIQSYPMVKMFVYFHSNIVAVEFSYEI